MMSSAKKKKSQDEIDELKKVKLRVGKHIKSHRIFLDMTQEEAAEKSGLKLRQYQNMEYGVSFSLPDFLRISKALRANPSDLLKENDDTK